MIATTKEPRLDGRRRATTAARSASALLLLVYLGAGCDESELVARRAAASPAMTLDPQTTTAAVAPDDLDVEAALDEKAIALDDLADHGGNAALHSTGRRLFILLSPLHTRAAIYVSQRAGQWNVSQIHGNARANPIIDALTAVKAARTPDGGDLTVVAIRGLHLTLLGHEEKGVLMLTPIDDRPDLNLAARRVQPATVLLSGLASAARLWASESMNNSAAR